MTEIVTGSGPLLINLTLLISQSPSDTKPFPTCLTMILVEGMILKAFVSVAVSPEAIVKLSTLKELKF